MQVSVRNPKLSHRSPPRRSAVAERQSSFDPTELVQLGDAQADESRPSGLIKAGKFGLGLLSGLSLVGGLAGGATYGASHLASCQEQAEFVIDLQNGEICVDRGMADQEAVVGYSGDADLSYGEVASGLLDGMGQAEVGGGYDVQDLQRLAADSTVSENSRLAAQELLADPILMTSIDVAASGRVTREITAEDLLKFAEQEPDAGAFTFLDLETDLRRQSNGTTTFDYFDSLGEVDDRFSRDELEALASDKGAPENYRLVAERFLDNPNLFNGFDVAQSAFTPHWWDLHLTGRQELDGIISREDAAEVRYSPTPEAGNQWTEQDRLALERVAAGEELSPDLFTAFRQTNRGNCVSVAVIKAAMDHYGGQVLKSFTPNDLGGYDIVMHDGFTLSLTGQELEAGATSGHFAGQANDTKSYANLLYTTAAKRAQLESHEGSMTFGQSLLSLNNGEHTRGVPRLLGLESRMKRVDLSEVPGMDGVVVYGGGHAYYVDTVNGQTLGDRWGKPTEYLGRSHINEGVPSRGAFQFESRGS